MTMNLRTCFTLLMALCIFAITNGQTPEELIQKVKKQKGDAQSSTYVELSQWYQTQKDSLAFYYAEKALLTAESELQRGWAAFQMANVYRDPFSNDPLKIKWLNETAVLMEGKNDSIAALSLHYLTATLQRKGMYPEALKAALKSMQMREKLPNQADYIRSLINLGYVYDRMGEYEKAISWHEKALEASLQFNDDEFIGRCYGLIGIAYDELEQFDKALEYNFKAIEYFKNVSDLGYQRAWFSNIGNTYTKLNDFTNAEKYTRMALALDVPTESNLVTLVNLGKIFLETERYQEAQKVLDSAVVLIQEADNKRFLSEAYYRLHELKKKEHKFEEALKYFELYKENEDFMHDEAKSRQINEMSIQYETYEKEKELLLKESKLQNRNFQLVSLLGLLCIVGLVAYLIFKRQQQKSKDQLKDSALKEAYLKIENQRLLEEQRMSISRDLHDNIGAHLTMVISSMEHLKKLFKIENQELETKLREITEFTKTTIGELRDTIWAMNKGQVVLEELMMRMTNYLAQQQSMHHEITFQYDFDSLEHPELKLSGSEAIHVYRILQEAIHNTVKHAAAELVKVSLSEKGGQLHLLISDNGKGMATETAGEGNGIANMRKRAEVLGGTIDFSSNLGEGTQIEFKCTFTI
jgi:signal transduction histidine kinase